MIKLFYYLCLSAFCFNCVNVYAGALDDLVNQQQVAKVEKKKQEQKKAKKAQEQAQLLENIADCEQAVQKATEARKAIGDKKLYIFKDGVFVDNDGFLDIFSDRIVVDFANDGVFIGRDHDYFIYTKNQDYTTRETFKENDVIYERVGVYKYTTVAGSTNSVPALRATKHKVDEINPKYYLKNKNLDCCQYVNSESKFTGEIGVHKDPSKEPVDGVNSGQWCRTRNHPSGYYGHQRTVCTGTDIY